MKNQAIVKNRNGLIVHPEEKTPYGPRRRVQISFEHQKSRTKQEFKDECDINTIIKRYKDTGVLPQLIQQDPKFGDFSDMESFQEAQNIIAHANQQFAALSSEVRERFGNNPEKFLEFVNDPENNEEKVKLGLAVKNEPQKPDPVVQGLLDIKDVILNPPEHGDPISSKKPVKGSGSTKS